MAELNYPGGGQASLAQKISIFLAKNWIWIFAVVFGLYVWLPFLAPVFMAAGFPMPGAIIQTIYSTQCHQMPDRSFFLFGPQLTYSLPQIQAAWQNTMDMSVLRQFVGNSQMGWKVAWSDRMVSMYTSTWIVGLLWWMFLRGRIRPLPLWGLILFWLPMAVDGGTHFISDLLGGMEAGFRFDNAWLASLTGHALPAWFYSGNMLGSFNSDMRLLTGLLFGIGLVWFAFPVLDQSLRAAAQPRQPVVLPLRPYESRYSNPALPKQPSTQNPPANESKTP